MGYEYGNARLRAMKSRLLTRSDYHALVNCGTLERLLTALTRTPYEDAIEATLVRGGELVALNAAFSHDLIVTVRKIRRCFEQPERDVIATALQRYDIHNIKAILRGVDNNVPPDEIRATHLPVGDLTDDMLAELASAPDPRAVIDLMASLRLPPAQPLLAQRARHPNAALPEFELALDRWYFESAFAALERRVNGAATLRTALEQEADLVNLLTVLRLVHTPADTRQYLKRFRAERVEDLFIGPGHIAVPTLAECAALPSLEAVAQHLQHTSYGNALAAGLDAYRHSQRLSDVEHHLLGYRLNWRAGLMRREPLGIGVVLGYLALKIAEIGNLRWITYGINSALAPKKLLEELELTDE